MTSRPAGLRANSVTRSAWRWTAALISLSACASDKASRGASLPDRPERETPTATVTATDVQNDSGGGTGGPGVSLRSGEATHRTRSYSFGDCATGGCEIVLEHIATLSDSAQPGMLGQSGHLRRDSKGRFIAIAAQRDRLILFDSSGQFLHSIGRRGDGPREFRGLSFVIVGIDDSLYAWSYSHSRVTVFASDSLFSRQFPAPRPPMFVRPDGSFLIAAPIPSEDRIGYPLHVMSGDGQFIRSFGSDPPEYRSDMSLFFDREAAPARDGSIWAIAPGRYVIERWDAASGRRLQEVRVSAPWFVESRTLQVDERVRPLPLIQRIWEDSAGFLWLVIRVADADWRPPAKANIMRPVAADERNAEYDWLLNVVDPRSGTIVASKRLAIAHDTRSPTEFLVAYRDGDGTHVFHDVLRPYLKSKEKQP